MHMIIDKQKLHPLVAAVEGATGRRPNVRTIMRWAAKGQAGIRLRTKMLGGRRVCSIEDVEAFVNAVTEARDGKLPDETPTAQSRQSLKERHKRLADALA